MKWALHPLVVGLISVPLTETFKGCLPSFSNLCGDFRPIDRHVAWASPFGRKDGAKIWSSGHPKRKYKYSYAYVNRGKDHMPGGHRTIGAKVTKRTTLGALQKGNVENSAKCITRGESSSIEENHICNVPNRDRENGEEESEEVYFVSTPVYYANDKPHIGHAYCNVLSDIICRFAKWEYTEGRRKRVILFSGMDEHGLKIERKSKKLKIPSMEYINNMSSYYQMMNDKLHVHVNIFYRTTSQFHKSFVQQVWKYLTQNGYIYKGTYRGYYDVNEEKYLNEFELKQKEKNDPNILYIEEENSYFFNILKFKKFLTDFYQRSDELIYPSYLQKEMLHFVNHELKDVCISRYNTQWGIKIPGEEKGTIYVWFDALLSYVSSVLYMVKKRQLRKGNDSPVIHLPRGSDTFYQEESNESPRSPPSHEVETDELTCSYEDILSIVGLENSQQERDSHMNNQAFPSDVTPPPDGTLSRLFQKAWNPHVQVIGKDILKFHGVLYICLLQSLNLKLPQKIICHGLIKSENVKMSKSIGNVISPFDIVEKYDPDIVRLYFFGCANIFEDKNFKKEHLESFQLFVRNNVGNLLYRVMSLCMDNNYKHIYKDGQANFLDSPIFRQSSEMKQKLLILIHNKDFALFLENLMALIKQVNKFFVHQEPWKCTNDSVRFNQIIYETLEGIKFFSVFLYPIMPQICSSILYNIGLDASPSSGYSLAMLTEPTREFALRDLIKIV
ncbi:methionine--tRNA ligase, putative [Plasmodium knowlesi strain H]|uniref:methionine--tRNA ligase n=3 Tax=Plasmodium knowlesi TaxID=5850 RepID=A0A5K1TU25_PLAKH|nr:methionine--tRNA ligase, putative [Plasmodium knowlesi strain H]OTN65920.1 putative Methionine--tRNA ligase [Plasmodium knowlesi]CAA9987680.1 methionine--tRNA ligase, putative [Plasmodium knowlesi strain H]SBO26897.1 methionine--tRNA ligase, putative [Plasmodium knowlesi strain H]SBO29642.1 methionine--tRNA ligase, putative [Plasmodium knowlesi strain H]VVS77154.1 methionine--tRNA ligase, putative [Plasmodium knowlesi strain H]|eukprot:XP_002258678.1 trna ligase, putative [Plasmodium knowlesi strain H]